MPYFPEQREIDVIFKHDGIAELLTQQAHDVEMIQADDVGSHLDGAALGIHDPGGGHHDGADPAGWVWLSRARRSESRAIWSSVQAPPRLVGRFVGLGENPARDIGEGDRQSACAQVDAEHMTAIRAQFVQHGSPSDIAAGSSHRANQPLLFECIDDFGHRLLRQGSHLGKVGPRDGAVVQQGLENAPSRPLAGHAGYRRGKHRGTHLIRHLPEQS